MRKDLIPKMTLATSRRALLHWSAVTLGGALLGGPAFAANLCRLTESEIVGPFYRFGAPFRSRLVGPDEPGDRLVLTGTVLSSDCPRGADRDMASEQCWPLRHKQAWQLHRSHELSLAGDAVYE